MNWKPWQRELACALFNPKLLFDNTIKYGTLTLVLI